MFQGWRLRLREAEEAADQGQLEEACQLLLQSDLRQYLPGKRLSARVAGELAERGRRRVIQGNLSAGWQDLQAARSLAGDISAVLAAREEIVALTLSEAESQVENGDPARAIALLEALERMLVQDEPLRWLKEVARRLESARLALRGRRFLLWVDGVGGYLVCLGNEVILGQACPGCRVEIPIQADLSRRHATIVRQGDGYVIEPWQATRINGQTIHGMTLLSDQDEIALGQTVRLCFRQPHALSASARLDFVSHHRTAPSADGVLLMAESCVLGPKWQNHVVCRDWQGDVVLYRRDGDLCCRAMEAIEIDGRLCDGRGQLHQNSHVTGSDFSMSLEELP